MSNDRLMTFEEFRASSEPVVAEAVRQQREHLSDRANAAAFLESNALDDEMGWPVWEVAPNAPA